MKCRVSTQSSPSKDQEVGPLKDERGVSEPVYTYSPRLLFVTALPGFTKFDYLFVRLEYKVSEKGPGIAARSLYHEKPQDFAILRLLIAHTPGLAVNRRRRDQRRANRLRLRNKYARECRA